MLIVGAFTGGYGSSGFTCEQDEYAEMVKQIKGSGIVKTNGSFLWSYKDTFKGKELADWLINSKYVGKILPGEHIAKLLIIN
jgi:hypothetical protein